MPLSSWALPVMPVPQPLNEYVRKNRDQGARDSEVSEPSHKLCDKRAWITTDALDQTWVKDCPI